MPDIECDVVIVGGGTAGCIVAARLAQQFPEMSFVLIEEGKESRSIDLVQCPIKAVLVPFLSNPNVRTFESIPKAGNQGRREKLGIASVLGGGSAVNWMIYNNPAASDFDDWNTIGWSFAELKGCIRRALKIDDNSAEESNGLEITFGNHATPWPKAFHEGMACSDDIKPLPNWSDFHQGHGYAQIPKFINKQGRRSESSLAYGVYDYPNLKVLTQLCVARVIFSEDNTAMGVEVAIPETSDGPKGEYNIIRATRQTILSAGTIGSPMILERSGVGQDTVLKAVGIDTRVHLSDVGQNLRNHNYAYAPFLLSDCMQGQGIDRLASNLSLMASLERQWKNDGRGMLSSNFADCGMRLRPSGEDIENMSKSFVVYWDHLGRHRPDKTLGHVYLSTGCPLPNLPQTGGSTGVGILNGYPRSTGHIHIQSADPKNPGDFDSSTNGDDVDVEVVLWMYKKVRNYLRAFPTYRGEPPEHHPKFAPGSSAICMVQPGPQPPIQWTAEDDKAILEWLGEASKGAFHYHGTCAMRARSDDGVVDAKLNVYGTRKLKIADLSIAPGPLGANTASSACIIGEKAAELVAEELRSI